VPYSVGFNRAAEIDMDQGYTARQAAIARSEAERLLRDSPTRPSSMRVQMDANPLDAEWELRLGELRLYYDVDEVGRRVSVLRAGIKRRNRVFIRGVEVNLRL
jgi:uncharacterized small protein (DUF1192 family)